MITKFSLFITVLFAALFLSGCATTEQLTPEEKQVVGTYTRNSGKKNSYRLTFLKDGTSYWYVNDKKRDKTGKWKMVDGELHADGQVHRINKDGSLTRIEFIDKDGKRKDVEKVLQWNWVKVK